MKRKWNSQKVKDLYQLLSLLKQNHENLLSLGMDENILKSLNVAFYAGRREIDALWESERIKNKNKELYQKAVIKFEEYKNSEKRIYASPRFYAPNTHLPFIGWSDRGPVVEKLDEYTFDAIEPIFIEDRDSLIGLDKINQTLRNHDGFICNGQLWWFVENEDQVYCRIADFNSLLLRSINKVDNDNYQLHKKAMSTIAVEGVSLDDLCTSEGVKMWFEKVEKTHVEVFSPNDVSSGYVGGLMKREEAIEMLFPILKLKKEGVNITKRNSIERKQLAYDFIAALYPEMNNDKTFKNVLNSILS